MSKESDEYFDKLWKQYPTDLCQGKKGASKTARESWNKYFKNFGGFDETEAKRIIHLTKVGAIHCRKDFKPDRWKFLSTYINQEVWADVLEWDGKEKKEKSDLKRCAEKECNYFVHGEKYDYCCDHLYANNDTHKEQRKKAMTDIGMLPKQGESPSDWAKRCREQVSGRLKTMIGNS